MSPERHQIDALSRSLKVVISQEVERQLVSYVKLVSLWNRKVDLIAESDLTSQIEILLADALVLSDPGLVPLNSSVLDIGSGVGAPTLPLILIRSDLHALLVEPRRKRVAFLHTAIGELELMFRLRVLRKRVQPGEPISEDAPRDVALSRATFAPEVWLRMGSLLAKRTLVLTAIQPPPQAPAGVRRLFTVSYVIPSTAAPRRITVYER